MRPFAEQKYPSISLPVRLSSAFSLLSPFLRGADNHFDLKSKQGGLFRDLMRSKGEADARGL